MALFQRYNRNDQLIHVTRDIPTSSQSEGGMVRLIVGLGNIGKEYDGTRHNIGFEAVDAYQKQHKFPKWQEKSKFKAIISESFQNGQKVILAKPTTFMNLSGEAVKAIKDFYKIENSDILIIQDEIDLPFGEIKSKQGGGSAGHNGLKSLISQIGEDFKRLRIGIRNDALLQKMEAADFVLAKFTAAEKKKLPAIIKQALENL